MTDINHSTTKPPRSRRKAPTAAVATKILHHHHDKSKSKTTNRRSSSNPHKESISSFALYEEDTSSPIINNNNSTQTTAGSKRNHKPNFLMKSSYFRDTRSLTPTTRAYGRKTHSSPICEYFDNAFIMKQYKYDNYEGNLHKVNEESPFEEDYISEDEGGVGVCHEEEENEDDENGLIGGDYLQKGEFFVSNTFNNDKEGNEIKYVNNSNNNNNNNNGQFEFMNNIKSIINKDNGSSMYSMQNQMYTEGMHNNKQINENKTSNIREDKRQFDVNVLNYKGFNNMTNVNNINNNINQNNINTHNAFLLNYNNYPLSHLQSHPHYNNPTIQQQQQQLYNYHLQQQQIQLSSYSHKPNNHIPQYSLPQEQLYYQQPPLQAYQITPPPLSKHNIKKITNQNYTTLSNSSLASQAHIISKYQSGSRFLQQKLVDDPSLAESLFFPHIMTYIQDLSTDQYGSLFIQKFISCLSEDKLFQFISLLSPSFTLISTDQYGSKLIESTLIGLLTTDKLYHSFIKLILPHFQLLLHETNSSKIIMKLLQSNNNDNRMTHMQIQLQSSLMDLFIKEIPMLAINKKGCKLLKDCFDSFSNDNVIKIVKCIEKNITTIITNQYGNYIIQSILEMKNKEIKKSVFDLVRNNLILFATQKYSSNVIEKCIDNNDDVGCALMKQILIGDTFERLLLNNFGNYVAQKVLMKVNDDVKDMLLNKVILCVPQLKQLPFGQKLLAKLLQQYPKLNIIMLQSN